MAKWDSLSIDYEYRLTFSISENEKPIRINMAKNRKEMRLWPAKFRNTFLNLHKSRPCGDGLLSCIALVDAVGGFPTIKDKESFHMDEPPIVDAFGEMLIYLEYLG